MNRYRFALIAIAAVATGIIAGVVIAGSGDDGGSSNEEVTVPELRPPSGSLKNEGDRGTTGDEETTTDATPDAPTGGAQAPPAETNQGGGAAQPEDTEQRDVPPPQGSPAERFEQFCQENPGAC